MADSLSETKKAGGYFFGSNPIIRKLSRIEETDAENSCTYSGIIVKLAYFMVMVLAGIIIADFVTTHCFP